MISIKILTFIFVIILLCVIYFFYYRKEHFSSQTCKEFANVNIVFHKLDFEPKINGKKLYNYTNEDFLDKFIVNNMNSIFRPAKIRFNNIKLIEENMSKNLRIHYDNFKINYRSYGRRQNPQNQDIKSIGDGTDYSALLASIRKHKLENYPLPIRKTMSSIAETQILSNIQNQNQNNNNGLSNSESNNVNTQTTAVGVNNEQALSFLSNVSNFRRGGNNGSLSNSSNSNNSINSQAEQNSILDRIRNDDQTSFLLNINELNDRIYDRIPIIQRFLIDKDCGDAYNSLSAINGYTLEMLIEEGQSLYSDNPSEATRTTRFNNFFDRLDIPTQPDSLRVNLKNAIIDFDSSVVYEPPIIDDAVVIYTEANYQGEQIVFRPGEYTTAQIRNFCSRGYRRQLDEDLTREWIINVGSSSTNPKIIPSMSPYLQNPYNSTEFFISAGLEIDTEPQNEPQNPNWTDIFTLDIDGYNVSVTRSEQKQGWSIYFHQLTRDILDTYNRNNPPLSFLYNRPHNHHRIEENLSNKADEYFRNLGLNDYFCAYGYTIITPTRTGTYTFYLRSDDGSNLYIANLSNGTSRKVIDNSGLHAIRERTATYNMEQGTSYLLLVDFFEYGGYASVNLDYSGAGFSRKPVDEGYHYATGWGQQLQLKVNYIDGDIPPANCIIVPDEHILEIYSQDNLEGEAIILPNGRYFVSHINISRPRSYKLRIMTDAERALYNNSSLFLNDNGVDHNSNMPNASDYPPINQIYASEIVYPTLPVNEVSFENLRSSENYYLANYGMRCRDGDIVPKDECHSAVMEIAGVNDKELSNNTLNYNNTASMTEDNIRVNDNTTRSVYTCTGSRWGFSPQGCSVKYDRPQWNSNFRENENNNECVNDDKFRRVCKRNGGQLGDSSGLLLGLDNEVNEILVNGPDKICSEMLDKFVDTDMYIIKESLNKNMSSQNVNVLLNLFVNCLDYSEYDDKNLHIYLVPFLPNNQKYYVVKGQGNKPLLLLSLYNTTNYSKYIETYDTTSVCKTFLSDYLVDKNQLIKFENEYDKLINGDKEKINELKALYEEKLENIENIRSQYPNMDEIIKKYNCVQRQLIQIYSKDYNKSTEVIKLKRLKHKNNYKSLVEDKIKELKQKDQVKIDKLTKESIEYKKIIDEGKNRVKELIDESEVLKDQLVLLYSGKVDKKLKDRYNNSINILKSKTSKLDYLVKKLGPPVMLSKIFCLINGLPNASKDNNNFDIINPIENNGIVLSKTIKDLMFENINKNKYLEYENKPNHNFVDYEQFMNVKCDLLELEMPKRAGFSKSQYNNDVSKIDVNSNNSFNNNEPIFKKDENNVLSYAGFVSKKNNNSLEFNYNTKSELLENQQLYSDTNINKANCLLGTNYFYNVTPKLELPDKIMILREIVENKNEYTYLQKDDIQYLERLLLFLEREFFGKQYKKAESQDLSNNKLDENYFRDKIFTKEEALNMLENVIIEAYKRKGTFNLNSKLSNVYSQNYYSEEEYYKNDEERNKLSPTRRVYNPPKEAIPCPLKPQEVHIKKDNRTLDDYMMKPLDCVDKHYMDSFKNSFI